MVAINVDIGNRSDALTADEISRIEKEFRIEHLPEEKREEYILEHFGNEKKIGKYQVILNFNDITICIGRNLDVVMKNNDPDEMSQMLEGTVITRLKKLFPDKNLEPGTYWQVNDFQRIVKQKNNNKSKSKFHIIRNPLVIGPIIGAIITAVALIAASIIQNNKP